MDFSYYLPVNLLFGRGRLSEVGKNAAKYGKRALIVCGGSAVRSGTLDRLRGYLESEHIESMIFDKVTPNPLTTTAEEGAVTAKNNGCDMVIGLGGGSILDCAKAIAFLAKNDHDINDYIYNRIQGEGALPMIAIPTTCGTGSEGNSFAVLTNPENGDKKSLRRNEIIPSVSIIDSELMQTMPAKLLACVGFDALCHSMEAFLSRAGQPMTEYLAYEGMKIITADLVNVCGGDHDDEAWDRLAWASTIGGMVINTAGVTLPHAMEHPLSGLKNITHGRGLAALTPVITEASAGYAPEKYAEISKLLGGRNEKDCADAMRRFLDRIGLNVRLSEEGVTKDDIAWLTENCFKVSAVSVANHPAVFDADAIAKLYEKAL